MVFKQALKKCAKERFPKSELRKFMVLVDPYVLMSSIFLKTTLRAMADNV
jgi:hypothetical protein